MLMVPVADNHCNPTRLPTLTPNFPEALVCGLGDTWQIHAFGSAANGFSSTESDLDVTCFLLKIHGFCFFWMLTLPETNIAPEMDGWKTIVSFRDGPFSGTC